MTNINLYGVDHTGYYIPAVVDACKDWPQSKRDKLLNEWLALESAGAQITEIEFIGGRFVTYPSNDIVMLMQAWGVYV